MGSEQYPGHVVDTKGYGRTQFMDVAVEAVLEYGGIDIGALKLKLQDRYVERVGERMESGNMDSVFTLIIALADMAQGTLDNMSAVEALGLTKLDIV